MISSSCSAVNAFPDAFAPVLMYCKCVPAANPFIDDFSPKINNLGSSNNSSELAGVLVKNNFIAFNDATVLSVQFIAVVYPPLELAIKAQLFIATTTTFL